MSKQELTWRWSLDEIDVNGGLLICRISQVMEYLYRPVKELLGRRSMGHQMLYSLWQIGKAAVIALPSPFQSLGIPWYPAGEPLEQYEPLCRGRGYEEALGSKAHCLYGLWERCLRHDRAAAATPLQCRWSNVQILLLMRQTPLRKLYKLYHLPTSQTYQCWPPNFAIVDVCDLVYLAIQNYLSSIASENHIM